MAVVETLHSSAIAAAQACVWMGFSEQAPHAKGYRPTFVVSFVLRVPRLEEGVMFGGNTLDRWPEH